MAEPLIAAAVASHLAPFLGAFNAKIWVKTVAERKLGKSAETLSRLDVAALSQGLLPALTTFMGRVAAEELVQKIQREVR
jgi:uncharacterized membrane protein